MLDSVPDIVTTREQTETVTEAFFRTGDMSAFARHNTAMMDDGTLAALAIMRGSGK